MASRAAPPTLLAIGVISAPQFLERRLALRSSWMLSPNVGASRVVEVRFVVRMEEAPAALAEALRAENDTFSGDVLGVSVAWNASRVKGPLLSLAAWLRFAARRLGHIQFIAKADDDLYIHTRDLEHLLRSLHAAAPAPSRLYLGSMSWFHWLPAIFERSGWGGTFFQSWAAGERCRNRTAACLGPFPFAAGFLIVLSRGLAGELASSETMADDVRRLKAARGLQQSDGRRAWKVLEDIWLGSLLYRDPPKGGPVRFVNMPEGLVVDKWGLRVTPTAVLVHLKHRLLERFLAVHDYTRTAPSTAARGSTSTAPPGAASASSTRGSRTAPAHSVRPSSTHRRCRSDGASSRSWTLPLRRRSALEDRRPVPPSATSRRARARRAPVWGRLATRRLTSGSALKR